MRLDNYLVTNNYFSSRNKAQQAIKNNRIRINNNIINKTGYELKENDHIEIESIDYEFVSRGGYKLLKAINIFNLDLNNKVVIDLGASTGGFTDCCLKFGAKKVYAIDVGNNQLDQSLLNNNKVISIENTNVKSITVDDFHDIDLIVMDLSFISIIKIINKLDELLFNNKIELILLIKPQFEVENKNINKKGLVKDKNIHFNVINKIIKNFKERNIFIKDLTYSPIKGEKSGNIEYLAIFSKTDFNKESLLDIKDVINQAYNNLL